MRLTRRTRTSASESIASPRRSQIVSVFLEPRHPQITDLARDKLNRIFAVGTGLFASVSAALLASAFWKSHSWHRPPRRSSLTWAALLLAFVAATTFALFVLTLPGYGVAPNDSTVGHESHFVR